MNTANGIKDIISRVKVYGLEESIISSGYPMQATLNHVENGKAWQRGKKLGNARAGSGHDCYLKGIVVQFDWRKSIIMERQALRYHFLDIVSSQSTMHRALKMNVSEQCNEYVDEFVIKRVQEMINLYNHATQRKHELTGNPNAWLRDKELRILYSLPAGYELTARVTTNYLQLKTIYNQRKSHKLPEWREFCKWCETLPHFEELVLNG